MEFLRWFARKLEPDSYALKGGVNLRFFFQSIRYSEDMDIDIRRVSVDRIKRNVLEILSSPGFSASLRTFGVERIVPPDMAKARQTETTQRFKIRLLIASGEDLFTKIEFSRREAEGVSLAEPVSARILRIYKMAPLVVSHYAAGSATGQKIQALAQRSVLQARDVFDLFLLCPQCDSSHRKSIRVSRTMLKTACENIFLVGYPQFRDTVAAYLEEDDRNGYASAAVWDEIKLRVSNFLEEIKNENA